MTDQPRTCEWCGGPLPADAKPEKVTCSDAHRALRWRWLHGIPRAGGRGPQEPPEGSPLHAARPAPVATRERRANAKRKPSGLQVSYRKAVEAVEALLTADGYARPRSTAERTLREALSDRQRAQLEARR